MTPTTKAQRKALKGVFDRAPILPYLTDREVLQDIEPVPLTYRQFRRGLNPTFGCDGAVVIQWTGMWLCIERDGYVHS